MYRGLMAMGMGLLGAIFAASFLVAALSQLLAVRRRVPVTLFVVPGIIPLVPGGLAYRTMLAFFHGEYAGGLAVGAQTLLSAGAIAAGLSLWTALFAAFRRRGPMRERVRETIRRYRLLERGDGVVIGVSGGPDSMALLHVLLALRDEYDLSLTAVHVHHQLRGAEADADAAFVADW
ncbi:threonine/serine exporter family protein, partial [Calditerricola satsumensis]|uniref:threonine/serine exporter family protein n=1 Tax=Calditerricola satsumensis TaxID=373054 RepID=UPI00210EFE8F